MLQNRFKPILHKHHGMTLGLWGEAGIGKSHQARELLRALPCQGSSLHATTSLATLVQTLPKPKKLALWAEHNLSRLTKGEAVENASILDSLGASLAGLAPFVLHLEDIHEADSERLEFIQALAKVVLRTKGVGLIVTSRREPPEPFKAIKLEPLSRQDTDALLEHELKASLPREALKWIYDKAAGNPLYTLEYLRYLTRQGFLWNDGKSWRWRKPEHGLMPVTVEALVEQLLNQARTEPLQRYVLETKALLPLDADDNVWLKVARISEQELQTAVSELSQRGVFLVNDFAHPLFREVTLRTMGAERRRNLARRAVNVFNDEPEQAALFVDEAGLEATKALALLKEAAARTKEKNEVGAARFLAKAVDYATGEEKGELALEAATVLKNHDLHEARRLAEMALTLFPGKTEIVELLMGLYATLKQRDKADHVLSLLSPKEKQSERGLQRQLRLFGLFHDHPASLNLIEKHPGLLESKNAEVLDDLFWTMIYAGEAEKAKHLVQHALALPDLTPSQRARFHYARGLTFIHFDANDRAAERELRQALAGFRTVNNVISIIAGLHAHACILQNLGDYQEALTELEEAAELSMGLGNISIFAETNIAIADQHRWFGNYERAEELYVESLTILRRHDDAVFLTDCLDNLAALYCDWRTPHSATLAIKYGNEALALAKSRGDTRQVISASCNLAIARILGGNPLGALELATQATELAQTPQQMLSACTSKAATMESLGRHDEARRQWRDAKNLAEEIGRPYNLQLVNLELDRLDGDVASARRRMRWFEERGLTNGVNIAKRYFPELADTTPEQVEGNVRLEVLGPLQVTRQTTLSVRGRKRQELLSLLLEARISGRSEVSRLALLDTVYPGQDEFKANSSLKNVVHGLRETLGERVIATTNTGYALGPCTSDAEQFLQTGDTSLWRGGYLEGLDFEESTLRDSLYTKLFESAETLLELDPKEAARVGGILVEAEPYNTDYLRTYLAALRSSKNHNKLTRHYRQARERLLEVGETLPETWQAFLIRA